ncbi:MAG: flagellar M-ring protein FliF [Acidobacteria bacterium]|nr:flagellar M-ring protein FliF [Acidobacteriota bacterium]
MKKLLESLSIRQRISIVVAALMVGAGIYAFTRWKHESDFKPLFTSMAAEDAGAVVQKIKESGVEYRLSEDGGSVLVPSAKLAELRLALASAGLPKSGRIGFELFDKNNFGVTEFAEQVNYHRALEGELERSVMSLAEVEQARVHLTFPKDSVFLESRQPAKGSVILKLKPGARLSAQNVQAISNLIASAVEGLAPEAVSVVDARGALLSRPRAAAADENAPSEAALDYRRRVEADLLAKINATLEPLLGAEKYRAAVLVDCDLTSGEQSEESFDPARSVMLTSEKTEDASGAGASSGVPGTASNLPRPTSRAGSTAASLSRRTENITYQASRTLRRIKMPQGGVKKVSVSVLVDQAVQWEGRGAGARRVLIPPSPEKLKSIRDLVAGVTGFTPDRGDQIVVETLPFESTLNLEPPAAPAAPVPGAPQRKFWEEKPALWIGAGCGAALLLLLLCLVAWRLSRKRRPKAAGVALPATLPQSETAAVAEQSRQLAAEAPPPSLDAQIAEREAQQRRLEAEALRSIKLPPVATKKAEILTKHLRDNIAKESSVAVQILRSWVRGEER